MGGDEVRPPASERDWASERRAFAAEQRREQAAERERLARRRAELAEERNTRPGEATWDYRERARQARKEAAGHRAEAEESRRRAEQARQEAHRQHPLAARFAELAGYLFAADSVAKVLERIVFAATDVVDGADLASIGLLSDGGRISTPAATDPLATALDELQYACGEGPCLEIGLDPTIAYLSIADLSTQERWPTFGPQAAREGVHAVLSLALTSFDGADTRATPADGPKRAGALNLYARLPHAFDHNARDVGLLLAAHASVALSAARTASHLRAAIDSRDVIGQAKGILMERRNLTAEQAFDVLRRTSQRLNIKLRDLAERIANTGTESG